ncbi:Type 1 glutamine amidotransferase-like domain-containing protein [Paractinoplanes atraurantiacus]|uniref:Dipeptidase E n=1 Tax=Paractinoplanes atraurantiacus TaxID=1036182 RepID=A0A285KKZ2_9ACTN|nr:Type 1 glutamine amidotransferase-like domain-containing protein [Actinoplanes atraurantiacus]SNY72076.1 dipeptidase E [Actinoplanes atraurantiacus]
MRVLLTSSGITNDSIREALTGLLGKPIAEASALFIPTALLPFPGGPQMVWKAIHGPLGDLGWKSLGLLELTALPSIEETAWVPAVREADVLLAYGGDPLFLADWMRRSGLAALLPQLRPEAVYVGVSAGSIAATTTFAETYTDPPRPLDGTPVVFDGGVARTLVTGEGVGLVDFAVIPHLENPNHPDATLANAETWASHIAAPTYAIDDDTAITVTDGVVRVVSEGQWKLFQPIDRGQDPECS